jgi:hypothetical protein
MWLLGETWRIPHLMAAIASAVATALTALFVALRFPDASWRLPGAAVAALLTGLNVLVFRFGGISQPYGFCLLLLVAGYWCAVLPAGKNRISLPFLAGFFCGVSASASLLTAPAGPVMLCWLFWRNRSWRAVAAFTAGVVLAFIPVLWLFALGPKQVWFGIIDYNLLYRLLDWPDANRQNLDVAISWIDSGHALLLISLAAVGLYSVRRAEFQLCAWLAIGLALYISTAVRPDFERYFVFTVPFLSILAAGGAYSLGKTRPALSVVLAALLVLLGLGRELDLERDDAAWSDFEEIARKVNEVTPSAGALYADEVIYFLTRRAPPSGMEMWNSHKFAFSAATLRLFHLMPQSELDRRVAAGAFATLETCEEEDYIAGHGYARLFASRADVGGCSVFWNYRGN